MPEKKWLPNISIEHARIGFRNFSGKEGRFNPAGVRNFAVFLDRDLAANLGEDGWNIKWPNPNDPNAEEKQPFLKVAVNYAGKFPPKVVLITSRNKTKLNEKTVEILDWSEISNVDLVIVPSFWNNNGKSGVKAYLKTMYVTVVEDEFEAKYNDVPEAGQFPVDDD